jgi:hypothetical protein
MKYIFMGIIVPWSAIIPILAAIVRHRHLNTKCWFIFLYLCWTTTLNIVSNIRADNGLNNLRLLHADTVVEMLLFSGFFIYAFQSRQIKTFIRVLVVLFPLFCIINFTFIQSIDQFNTYTRPVEAIIFIILSLLYWWKTGKTEDGEGQWVDISENWFVSGNLLYFSSALFLFIFTNYLIGLGNKNASMLIWNLHAAIVLIMYLFFTIGFLKCKK